jgi:drug/metabolite transporter (DMT)-like permease
MFGLVMHWVVLYFRIPFPGYEHELMRQQRHEQQQQQQQQQRQELPRYSGGNAAASEQDALLKPTGASTSTTTTTTKVATTPVWMYFFLAVPSIFDLAATALCMMGLRYLDVSIYQLLRGSGIIFVALMKQHVLGDRLYVFQWIGVLWNVVSVVLVGATAVLNSQGEHTDVLPAEALLGVALVMAGAFVQALQFVFEEKVMTMDEASAPPLLLIGMEGLWGTVLCLLVVYPVVYYIPGSDHGSYEDPFNTWAMFVQSPNIQIAFCVYFFAIFAYNLFAVLVTFMLNSVWRAYIFWVVLCHGAWEVLDRSHSCCLYSCSPHNEQTPSWTTSAPSRSGAPTCSSTTSLPRPATLASRGRSGATCSCSGWRCCCSGRPCTTPPTRGASSCGASGSRSGSTSNPSTTRSSSSTGRPTRTGSGRSARATFCCAGPVRFLGTPRSRRSTCTTTPHSTTRPGAN